MKHTVEQLNKMKNPAVTRLQRVLSLKYTVKQLNRMKNGNDPFWVPIVCTDEEMEAAYAKVQSPEFNGDLTEYRKTLYGPRWREVHSR